jgi:hypothetical protein
MLDFAHRMLREGNWKGGLPFVLEEAHMSIATCYANDEAAYWQTPIVGQDIKALFEAYLKVYPNNNSQRTAYAKMAYKCGLYAEATEQFDILGKDYWGLRFKDKKEYEAMRADAKTKALLNNKK